MCWRDWRGGTRRSSCLGGLARPACSSLWGRALRARPHKQNSALRRGLSGQCCPCAAATEDQRATAFKLADDVRRAGHAARLELAGRSVKGVFKQADRLGARYVAVLGDDGVALKDMASGEQQTVQPDTVMHHIRGGQL